MMFTKALPIWLKGMENEKNIQAEFTTEFDGCEEKVLKITGATFYRVYLNGHIIHYGPARTAGDYARIDTVPLSPSLLKENNLLKIEAAGYNCNSYATVMQPSFIQAEVLTGSTCIAATGYDFIGFRTNSRVQNVMRYSFQRHFSEIWKPALAGTPAEISVLDLKLKYLKRHAPLPDMTEISFNDVFTRNTFTYNEDRIPQEHEYRWMQRFITGICDDIIGFKPDEITEKPLDHYLKMEYSLEENRSVLPMRLKKQQFAVIDCKKDYSGMIRLKYKASKDCRVYIVFDEKIRDGRIAFSENINLIQLDASEETDFTCFEIYCFKYIGIFVIDGQLDLKSVSVVSYKNPINNPPVLNCPDPTIQSIYKAALETLRQNSVDIYTDCPSRERAGWLCDSYFSAQAEYAFTGKTCVEDDFVENYLLQSCPDIPEGMLPMCYPADHLNHDFIPQWAMWFVLEIEQYAKRNKDFDIARFKDTAYKLLGFFKQYENELYLLEDLPAWNFVEWSKANDWTEGVNFPTNMLYSHILSIIGNMYSDNELIIKSNAIKRSIIEMSYNGRFFRDQALRDQNNRLICCEHISEVCQYYAFRFDIADPESFETLHNTLITEFYPETKCYPEIEKVNAFMGMYMRMELLMSWGRTDLLTEEIHAFFSHMEHTTGTLWEHKDPRGSLNHGFASYVGALLLKIYN